MLVPQRDIKWHALLTTPWAWKESTPLPQKTSLAVWVAFSKSFCETGINILYLGMSSCSGKEVDFFFYPGVGYNLKFVFLGLTLGSRTEHKKTNTRVSISNQLRSTLVHFWGLLSIYCSKKWTILKVILVRRKEGSEDKRLSGGNFHQLTHSQQSLAYTWASEQWWKDFPQHSNMFDMFENPFIHTSL
jgi:hypothetical protein